MKLKFRLCSVCFIAAVLCGLLVPLFANGGELFRYTLPTKDGRKFEYVFESSAQPVTSSITKDEATEIAANWAPTSYHLQRGRIEYTEFYQKPLPHWLVCFADTVGGPIQNLLFAQVCEDLHSSSDENRTLCRADRLDRGVRQRHDRKPDPPKIARKSLH